MLKLVIFDLDGVLIDSESVMRSCFSSAYLSMSEGEPPIERFLSEMGRPLAEIAILLGLPSGFVTKYDALAWENYKMINAFPECRGLLATLGMRRVKCAVYTGKSWSRTNAILEHLALHRYFDLVLTSDKVSAPKPNPEGLHRILDTLGVSREDAVMIGDGAHDMACARSAGVRSIGVLWGIRPDLIIASKLADQLVDSWTELADTLLNRMQSVPLECA